MPHEYPDPDQPFNPDWIAPLLTVAAALEKSTRIADSFFDPDDFMIMGWYRRRGKSTIMLYKHRDTRRYLNVDSEGTTYWYVAAPLHSRSEGSYRHYATLRLAVDRLGLWELPWMRDDLAHQRCGFPYEDRAAMWDRLTTDGPWISA